MKHDVDELKEIIYKSHSGPVFPCATSYLHESLGIHEFVRCDGIPYLYECKCTAFAALIILDDKAIVSEHHDVLLADFTKITSDVARWYVRERKVTNRRWPCYKSKHDRMIIAALPQILHLEGDIVRPEWI
jgi:hypothetical protein